MTLITSLLTGGVNSHQETSETANGVATDMLVKGGVVGVLTNTSGVAPTTGNFSVNAQGTPDMTVAVGTGVAYVQATPTSQNSQTLRIRNSASANVTISANSSGSTKYDWVYISVSAANAAAPNSAGDNVATLVTSRSSNSTSDDGTPPTYGTLLAVVTVANGASSIANASISDRRVRAVPVGGINDTNGNEVIKVSATASAVNEVTVTNAVAGSAPIIGSSGADSNVDLEFAVKGTAYYKFFGGYKNPNELGRTILSVAGDTISVQNLPARKYLRIYVRTIGSGTINHTLTFNNDTGANYAQRTETSGAADGTSTSRNNIQWASGDSNPEVFWVLDVINESGQEKLVNGIMNGNTAGAANIGFKIVGISKWANTSAQITRVDLTNANTGDFAIGSEVVVIGWN